jgi:plastocyanin
MMKTLTIPTRALGLALVALSALVLAACGGDSGGYGAGGGYGSAGETAAPSQTPTLVGTGEAVAISGFAFSPASLAVEAGTTVTWTNDDGAPHTVTSTDGPGTSSATTSTFGSGTLQRGDSFSHTFEEPGTYYYACTLHAEQESMHAEVVVR